MGKPNHAMHFFSNIFGPNKRGCLWKHYSDKMAASSLFLLCVEGLSTLIHDAARNQVVTGISISRCCPKVTHLFFVDDSILFCKACWQECQSLRTILQRYEEASGQKINTDKSSVFFNLNTSQETKQEIFSILGPMQDSNTPNT